MAKSVPKMTASDISYAIKELEAWRDGQRGRKLTWALIAKVTGFSRQTLEAKPKIYKAWDEAKKALAKGNPPRKPTSDDFHVNKIDQLEEDLKRYKAMEADWLERWVRIAYHARGRGLSIEDLDKPLPRAARR